MESVIQKVGRQYQKQAVVDVRSGDTVRVHQKIREGSKERIQVFQGLVIKTSNKGNHLSRITVRRISSGIGVEKSFLLHNPLVVKVEITKRSKVRRNYLSYMRSRTGKSARLSGVDFDKSAVNAIPEPEPVVEAVVEEKVVEPETEKVAVEETASKDEKAEVTQE